MSVGCCCGMSCLLDVVVGCHVCWMMLWDVMSVGCCCGMSCLLDVVVGCHVCGMSLWDDMFLECCWDRRWMSLWDGTSVGCCLLDAISTVVMSVGWCHPSSPRHIAYGNGSFTTVELGVPRPGRRCSRRLQDTKFWRCSTTGRARQGWARYSSTTAQERPIRSWKRNIRMTELHCVRLRVLLLPSVYINTHNNHQHDCGHPRKWEEEAQKNNTNRRHYTTLHYTTLHYTHTHTHTHTPPSVYINTQQRRITGHTLKP